jgi:hypothetical protein
MKVLFAAALLSISATAMAEGAKNTIASDGSEYGGGVSSTHNTYTCTVVVSSPLQCADAALEKCFLSIDEIDLDELNFKCIVQED